MPDEWGGISIDEDEFGGIAVEEEPEAIPVRAWEETAPAEPAPIAPTFEAPVSITEQGPVYKSEQDEAARQAALWKPETIRQPSSLIGIPSQDTVVSPIVPPDITQAERIARSLEAPEKLAPAPKPVFGPEALLPMMDEASRSRDWLKSQFDQQDMTDEEFLSEHPNLKYAMYGFMGPTDMPVGRISEIDAKNLGFGNLSGVVAGSQNAVADFVDFMTSAPGVVTAMTGGIAGAAGLAGEAGISGGIHKGVAYTFAADMARQAPEQFAGIIDAIENGNTAEATRGILGFATSVGIIGHGAKLAVTPKGTISKPIGIGRPTEPLSQEQISGRLKQRYNIDTGDVVQVVEDLGPKKTGTVAEILYSKKTDAAGNVILDPKTGEAIPDKPIGITVNRRAVKNQADLDYYFDHELGHWSDLLDPDRTWRIISQTTAKERSDVDADITKLRYSAGKRDFEFTARLIHKMAIKWRERSWFNKMVFEIQYFLINNVGMKASAKVLRARAEKVAVHAIMQAAESVRGISAPRAVTPESARTRTEQIAREVISRPEPTRAPPPTVPYTPPESQRGMTVIEEIRQAGARTKAEIQQLFPGRELTRQEAGRLRKMAWEDTPEELQQQLQHELEQLGSFETRMQEEEPPAAGTVRLYSGTQGSGIKSSWFTEKPERASSFGPYISYIDVPTSVADASRQRIKTDYVLPDTWVRNAITVSEPVPQRTFDVGTFEGRLQEGGDPGITPQELVKMDPQELTAWRKRVLYGPRTYQLLREAMEPGDAERLTAERDRLRATTKGILDEVEGGTLKERLDAATKAGPLYTKSATLNEVLEAQPREIGAFEAKKERRQAEIAEKAMGVAAPVESAGITIPSKLKLKKGEELRLTISEYQEYQDYIKRGFTPEEALEVALTISGRTTSPVKPQMIRGTISEASTSSVGEKGMGAAAPHEFSQPARARAFRAFEGWTGRAKEALQRLKEYFTPPQVGALPEVEIQSGAILPRLPDYAKEKVIASAPHGMAKVPGLGALMDTRAVAHSPADAAFLARANSVSKGKTFAALWAQTQWRNKDLFHVEQDTGSFRLANGERGYLSDVIEAELRDSGSQPLTYAQWQWIHQEWRPVLDEIRRQMHNEGVQRIATEDMDFDLSTDYFPRPAIGKRNRPTTGAGGRPAGRPGAKQFFQKSRKYASEEEGARPGTAEAPKEEIIYDPDPVSRVTKFISGAYRSIADHRLANDPALGAGTVPDYWGIGRQTMAGPAFAGKIYPVEVAQKIERQFAQDVRGWVRNTANLTAATKALMATADLSGPFIQGAAMFGRHPVRWAKATANSYRALTDPNYVAKLMEHPRYKELAEGYSQSGGSLLQLQDFLSGLQEGQLAARIPYYGKLLTATGRAYGAFLDLAKLELFDAWRKVTPEADMPRLVETIENSLFMGRMEQAGMNPHRAIGERLLLFAPAYYRGAGGLLSTAFQKGVSGKMARQMLGGYASAAMLVSMSAYLAMGMDWDEIKERLQPGRGKFLKIPVSLGDGERIEVGIGNILTQLVRLAGQAANYHTSNKPIDTGVEANPYLRFLRGRSAFLPGVGIELATGRDYFGNRITAKESIARHFIPFVFQSMFPRDEASFRQRAGDAAFTFFGLNAYPESEYEKARNQMDQTARKVGGKPFSQLNVAQRAKVVYQFKQSPDYKKREPSPTDMERIIHLNAERQASLQKDLGDSAETLARVGLRVPGYRGTFRYKGVDVPMTESERERYQEILASMYQARIAKLNEAALLKRPLVEREKWWSDEAEKIGVIARKRLMQEISKNTIK